MKPDVTKLAAAGLAVGALTLCIICSGCGGGSHTDPIVNVPIGNSLPVVCSNSANGARFQVDDFGAGFYPTGANSMGQVVGYKTVSGKTRTIIWKNGTTTDVGLDDAQPVAINNAGQVAGNTQQGFVWQNGQTTMLKNLPGGNANYVMDMNNNGEIVGSATTGQKNSLGSDVYHAAYWSNAQAVPQDLGVLNTGEDFSGANSINDQGQIVGYSGMVMHQANYVYMASHSSKMQDLGLLAAQGGSFGYGQITTIYISKSGLIVGLTFLNGVSDIQVFLMKPNSAPTYDTSLRYASKPNSTDQFIVIGKTSGYALYESGKGAQGLTALLPSNCSVQLKDPIAIADSGQILANGTVSGVNHGFLIRQ